MPTYEYECAKCGHTFERFQSMNDKPVKRCPVCRCSVRRLFGTGAGIIFKGSGFYETDYRSDGYKQAAKKDVETPASSSADTAKSDGKSDGKSAETATAAKSKKTAKAKA